MSRLKVIVSSLVALVLIGAFVARHLVSSYYASPEFKRALMDEITAAAAAVGSSVTAEIASVQPRGWFDFALPDVRLHLADGSMRRARAEVNVGLFPELISKKPSLDVTLEISGEGRIAAAARLDLTHWADVEAGKAVPLTAVAALSGNIERLSAAFLASLFKRPGKTEKRNSKDAAVTLKSGTVSGTFFLRNPGKLPEIVVDTVVESPSWSVATPLMRKNVSTASLKIALIYTGREIKLSKPITWKSELGSAQVTGRMVLAKTKAMAYDLDITSKGPIARLAMAALFQCRTMPVADTFKVNGPLDGTRCQ